MSMLNRWNYAPENRSNLGGGAHCAKIVVLLNEIYKESYLAAAEVAQYIGDEEADIFFTSLTNKLCDALDPVTIAQFKMLAVELDNECANKGD